ncbi:MAG: 4Fe-4S dicluster domain-containing protein [Sulfolobales archaeon]|nr:4Fe-4S dicluster domain-containing protein [Sulfolobales archaeon]MCX8186755.1 4Fe-4S dicluster domain-containing protein [Sulfolobales archaeon]
MVNKLVVDFSKCVGCRYCELWCSFKHYGVFSPSLSRIAVVKDDFIGMDQPVVCKFCDPAPCVASCPVNALIRSGDGVINVNSEACVSCSSCVESCPYGAIKLHPNNSKPIVCDLCGGNPTCVLKCPTNALRIYPVSSVDLSYRDLIKSLGKEFEKSIQLHKELMALWGVRLE